MRYLCIKAIRFYQRYISPVIGAKCIYLPTCSQYTLEAIREWGVVRGILMGAYRILRCNPFAKGGFNPVKINYKGKAKWVL